MPKLARISAYHDDIVSIVGLVCVCWLLDESIGHLKPHRQTVYEAVCVCAFSERCGRQELGNYVRPVVLLCLC